MIFLRPLRRSAGSLGLLGAAAVAVLASSSQLTACDATGEVEGGDPFDGGETVITTTPTPDGGEGGTMVAQKGCAGPDASTGSTYTELYQDYFGPSGGANCSGTVGACHGEASGAGALGSGGFVCGATQADCFSGMSTGTADLLSASSTAHPENSGLEVALRKSSGTGTDNMPLTPVSCVFSDDDIARISAWIAAGAAND